MSTTLSEEKKVQRVQEYCRQTTGTNEWYEHWTNVLTYTDGVKFVAETCGAYWLIDVVASYQRDPGFRRLLQAGTYRDFQVWRLEPHRDREGNIDYWVVDAWTDSPEYPGGEDGPASVRLCRQEIGCSDFPEGLCPDRWKFPQMDKAKLGFQLWVENGVLLLKEER